jgi:hypothetical protein
MEGNELMIGDWFQYADGNKKGTIVGIKCDARYLEQEAHLTIMDCNGKWYVKELDDLKAIPLSPEILEKNGWKQKKGFMQHGNFGNGPLMIWHTEDNKILRHFTHEMEISDLSSDRGFRIRFDCNYVHQLQHALKLCGIEKEIQL